MKSNGVTNNYVDFGGGSSGGGIVLALYGTTLSNSGTVQVIGGLSTGTGQTGYLGGAGGAGYSLLEKVDA